MPGCFCDGAHSGESTYQAPADWDWLQTQGLETSFYDAESSEVANSSTATWSNDISLVSRRAQVGQQKIQKAP